MAAYYHLLVPIEISIQDEPTLVSKFEETYGDDFKLKNRKRVESFSPPLPSGART